MSSDAPAAPPPPPPVEVVLPEVEQPPPPLADVQPGHEPDPAPVEIATAPAAGIAAPSTATSVNPWLTDDDASAVTGAPESAGETPFSGAETAEEPTAPEPVEMTAAGVGAVASAADTPSATEMSQSADTPPATEISDATSVPDVTSAPAPVPVEQQPTAAPPTIAPLPPAPPSEMRLPPPTAPGSNWTPPSPVEGMPTSLMPPPGSAPSWVEHPPPPGSLEPIVPVAPPAPLPAAAAPSPQAPPAPITIESGDRDGHDIARLMAQLMPATRPHAEVPAVVAAALLHEGERAELIVPGLIDGLVGIALLTSARLLLVNARQWSPVVVDFPIRPGLVVQGWQDDTYAQLTFEDGQVARIESIIDKPLAFDLARLVRERVAGLTAGS